MTARSSLFLLLAELKSLRSEIEYFRRMFFPIDPSQNVWNRASLAEHPVRCSQGNLLLHAGSQHRRGNRQTDEEHVRKARRNAQNPRVLHGW